MSAFFVRGDAVRLPFPDRSIDLVFGSPPYQTARTYGIGAQRDCLEWVEWMLQVVTECQRVCRGPVVIVASNVTKDRNYQPGCEGLMWDWWKRGGECQLYRPVFWHRSGIPGSGGKDWFRSDIEYCMCFKLPGELAWSNNTAKGHLPKFAPGGDMSNRLSDGKRVNQWGGSVASFTERKSNGKRKAPSTKPSHKILSKSMVQPNGRREEQGYDPPALANPGNLLKTSGGHLGNDLAHENEAPFPEALAEFFVESLCPPGGVCLDPFSGSGTTAAVCERLGRIGIGLDIRQNQCLLGTKRVSRPHAPIPRAKSDERFPLFEGTEP